MKSGTHIENRRAFVFIKHIHLLIVFKWPVVSLDKTFIHRLVSFIALWSCTKTVILTFNRLESIEVHYMDKNSGKFSSKTLIYFRLKKEIHKHLGWHGGEYILIWKWTNPLISFYWLQIQYVSRLTLLHDSSTYSIYIFICVCVSWPQIKELIPTTC